MGLKQECAPISFHSKCYKVHFVGVTLGFMVQLLGERLLFFKKKKKRQKDFNLVRLPCEKRNCSQTPEATKRFFEFIEEFNVARWN